MTEQQETSLQPKAEAGWVYGACSRRHWELNEFRDFSLESLTHPDPFRRAGTVSAPRQQADTRPEHGL